LACVYDHSLVSPSGGISGLLDWVGDKADFIREKYSSFSSIVISGSIVFLVIGSAWLRCILLRAVYRATIAMMIPIGGMIHAARCTPVVGGSSRTLGP